MPILAALLSFVAVLGVMALIFSVLFSGPGPREEQIIRRLEAIKKAKGRGSSSPELDLLRDELLSEVPALNRLLTQWVVGARFRKYMAQSGLSIKPGKLFLICGVLALVAYLGVQTFLANSLFAIGAGVIACLLPLAFVAFKRWSRLRAFEKNFPEAIDLLGRAVRAGHAFTTGLEMIGKELPEPVAAEFRLAFDEQNFGLPLKDALLNLAERVPLIDVRFFVVALVIQKETGGNLAEILDNLSHVIRERFKIYGEVRTKTAHGRMTGGILMALPPGMMILMKLMNPEYVRVLFTDPWGPTLLAVAAIMQVAGCILLLKIVQIEV